MSADKAIRLSKGVRSRGWRDKKRLKGVILVDRCPGNYRRTSVAARICPILSDLQPCSVVFVQLSTCCSVNLAPSFAVGTL